MGLVGLAGRVGRLAGPAGLLVLVVALALVVIVIVFPFVVVFPFIVVITVDAVDRDSCPRGAPRLALGVRRGPVHGMPRPMAPEQDDECGDDEEERDDLRR